MTNLAALNASVMYPVDTAKLEKALFDRGVSPEGDYSLSNKKLLDLATADLYVVLITTPTITEGGYQISLTDKSNLMKVASGIYDKYGEYNPFATQSPTISPVSPW